MRKAPAAGSFIVSNGADGIGQKITNFHYPYMNFTPPEFVEYPKWVQMTGYPDAIAQNEGEELELRVRPPRLPPSKRPIVSSHLIQINNGVVAPTIPAQIPAPTLNWWQKTMAWFKRVAKAMGIT